MEDRLQTTTFIGCPTRIRRLTDEEKRTLSPLEQSRIILAQLNESYHKFEHEGPNPTGIDLSSCLFCKKLICKNNDNNEEDEEKCALDM